MAELVDALVSGISDGNIVGVRVPFWAEKRRRAEALHDEHDPCSFSFCGRLRKSAGFVEFGGTNGGNSSARTDY
jgi:hypothetical protein